MLAVLMCGRAAFANAQAGLGPLATISSPALRGPAAILAASLLLAAACAVRAAPLSLELELEFDPARRNLQAVAQVAPASRDFRFSLHRSLVVGAARVDGRLLPVAAAGTTGEVRHWRVALPAGTGRLRLEYGGTLPALDRRLDHRGVLQDLPPMASAAGSFLPAGSAWYPRPAPLFAYRVSVSLPLSQRALVPGRLLSESVPADGDGRYRATFEFSRPAAGIDLMAGPWVVRETMMPRGGDDPIRLRTGFFPELDAEPGLVEGYLEDSRRYLERYSREIGPYPYSEFSVVASPLPTGFGMPTLTYLGAEVLKLPFIRATSLGHEVLHNWWGNGVHVADDGGNWSEGLTTFMADYAYQEGESPAAARAMRLGWLRDFAAVPTESLRPLAAFRSRSHGAEEAVGYGKAAMLFLMLRDQIGEEAFRNGLQAFWRQWRFRAASWNDLRAAFETAAGRPLAAFFAQWLGLPGGPEVRIARAVARSEGGRTRLTIDLEQSAPPYALRLPLEIVHAGRSETRWIEIAARHERIVLDLDAIPAGLRLDPDLRIWRRLAPEELPPILRQWIVARAPRLLQASAAEDVREAAEALARRLFEAPPQAIAVAELGQGDEPILLAGRHAEIDAVLAAAGLPPRPARLAGHGSAQVWTVERPAGPPLAVVSADDAAALLALLRPLPHYGGQSWLVFAGSRALERGVWPAAAQLLPVRGE